jgi:carbamate kinase
VRALIALGGNAMTSADNQATPEAQHAAITAAMQRIAELVAAGVEVALTHGNGPQVGNLLVKNELAAHVVPPVPLDWCGAQTQATIGFMVLDALEHALSGQGLSRPVAALVSRTLVDRDDPAFRRPTKPIGRFLSKDEAQVLIGHGETWEDRGPNGWRRVVASPEPIEVLDAPAAASLMAAGYIVVAAGGGGVPVVRDADGSLRGVEAVLDKDLTADLLARALGADVLVIATDVEQAVVGFGTPDAQPLGTVTPEELRRYAAAGHFASGSMAPKVEAAVRFVERGGSRSVITSLDLICEAVTRPEGVGTVVSQSLPVAPSRTDPL